MITRVYEGDRFRELPPEWFLTLMLRRLRIFGQRDKLEAERSKGA
jgi:hypothetical protein